MLRHPEPTGRPPSSIRGHAYFGGAGSHGVDANSVATPFPRVAVAGAGEVVLAAAGSFFRRATLMNVRYGLFTAPEWAWVSGRIFRRGLVDIRRRMGGSVTFRAFIGAVTMVAMVMAGLVSPTAAGPAGYRSSPGRTGVSTLSAGGPAWFQPPVTGAAVRRATAARVAFGSNVDPNNPNRDLAPGQSETAIAAAGSTVVAAWNDATSYEVTSSTDRRASLTSLGLSTDGGRTFRDVGGLRNDKPNQQWFGDPTVVAIDAHHFAIGSMYIPSSSHKCLAGPARYQLAVEILTIAATGVVSLGLPVVAADGGNTCGNSNDIVARRLLASLDKDWLSYDPVSGTLVMSFIRRFFGIGGQSGLGQVEMVRAHLPRDPRTITAASWSRPIVVWPEEPTVANAGAYVAVAAGGDAYLSWERNIGTNQNGGNPFVFVHTARVRAGDVTPVVGGPAQPRVVTLGQRNSNGLGGVKSLNLIIIPGYGGSQPQDFPRIAVDAPLGKVVIVWNDASAHPLGDIWMRALPRSLTIGGPIVKVNDDNSYALHFLPAVSIHADGAIATSWYDRRLGGADSARTDYYADTRPAPTTTARDARITTGSTDWANTSSLLLPNFGDYTDNTSTGNTTYYTWTDGRIGVTQPFVDHR